MTAASGVWATNGQRLRRSLAERRRSGLEQAQRQAPALTVAAQAFQLPVLTNTGIEAGARLAVLVAGLASVGAALLSLWRLRSREVLFSEVFAHDSDQLIPDIRAISELPRKPPRRPPLWLDERLQKSSDRLGPPNFAWSFALAIFFIADAVAYGLTVS
jgi:tRNA U34 5-methylaminomethyl-2-thiouridine-forming methyltransferase MnmC